MINLRSDDAVIALCGRHLLLLIISFRHLHQCRLNTEHSVIIVAYGIVSLLDHFWIRNLSVHTQGSWCTSCNAMRMLGAEYAVRYLYLAIGKLLHPIISSWLHGWLHRRWLLLVLTSHVFAGHIHLIYNHFNLIMKHTKLFRCNSES